jgi:hypothetical protein
VRWEAEDHHPSSGVESYDVQYRVDNGSWMDWKLDTTEISSVFGPDEPVEVEYGRRYSFRVRAKDRAGNEGEYPEQPSERISTTLVEKFKVLVPLVLRAYKHNPYEPNDSLGEAYIKE